MDNPRKYAAQERYEAEHVERTTLKLNKKTDADILRALEGKAKQTEIKRLIRLGLAAESVNLPE